MPDPFRLGDARDRPARDPFALGPGIGPARAGTPGSVRAGVDAFLGRRPIWLLYARADHRYPCTTCCDLPTGSPRTCPTCLGLGFAVALERHPTRLVYRPDAQGGSPLLAPGYLPGYPAVIHTTVAMRPAAKDLYCEVEWDRPLAEVPALGRPARLLHSYQVDVAVPRRESEVSYFSCGCHAYDFDQENLQSILATRTIP